MSFLFRVAFTLLIFIQIPPCFAEQDLEIPGKDIDITAHDRAELSLHQFPARGKSLAIWIANGYGLSPRDIQLASALSRHGVEVWQIDFAQSLFQVGSSHFMRELDPAYVVDLINAAQQRTHKQVILISHSYGAIPALRGATLWQQSATHGGRLKGVILISPDLYASVPALGFEPEYLPITHSTTIPLVVYQAGKRGNASQFPRLLAQLRRSNHNLFFKLMPAVTSPMYPGDTSKQTLALLKTLPAELAGVIHMLGTLPAAPRPAHFAFQAIPEIKLDSRLKPYGAHPQPDPIALRTADNTLYRINDYRGKVTVINFWATWCRPCREEIPSLNRLRQRMQDKPFQLISINYAESAATIKHFLKEVKVEYPVLLDLEGKTSAAWKIIAYPSTFVIGSDGKIHYGVNAAIDWDSPEVVKVIESLMKGS